MGLYDKQCQEKARGCDQKEEPGQEIRPKKRIEPSQIRTQEDLLPYNELFQLIFFFEESKGTGGQMP